MNSLYETLKYSPLESSRFNAIVYRGYIEKIFAREMVKFIVENNIDHIIFRIKSDNLSEITKLDNTPFPYVFADTLLYYSCDLSKSNIRELKNKDIIFEECNTNDIKLLENLVENIFVGYRNHYYTNPFLSKDNIIDGYKEWATNYIKENNSKIVFKVIKQEETIAFATCSFDKSTRICEGVLYGVLPQHSGGGIYSDLIRFTKNYFKERNFQTMRVSTQSHNYPVQKVWTKEEFLISESYNTIHINSLFNKSKLNKNKLIIEFNEDDIKNFIKISGDDNKLHTSDEFAKGKGFDSKIAHGVLINSVISKHFGKHNPGDGTIFMNYKYYFFNPIYPNRKYQIEISYPQYIRNKNRYLALVKIFDSNKNLCVLSYNNLLKK